MYISMSIGKYIRGWLNEKERSIRWLALRAGMSDGYLHGIINDKHAPSIEKIRSLAQAMSTTLPDLLRESGIIPEEWAPSSMSADGGPVFPGISEESDPYSSDLIKALEDPEMRDLLLKIWKIKTGNPGLDVREFLDRYLGLPENKKLALLAMIE